jgi:AraC-like DNA-binding protein
MASTADAVAALRFTTRGVPVPSRRRALYELRERGLLPLEPLTGCAPRVDLVKWRLPGASVLSGTFAGVRQGGESRPAGPDGELFFGINVSGASLAGQRGREITVAAGDAIAVDPDTGPFSVLRPAPARMIGLRVPRRSVLADPGNRGATPLRLVPAGTAALQLLTGYLRSALSSPVLSSAVLADAVVSHTTELIALSLDPGCAAAPPASARGVRAARLAAVRADIERHLTDGSLSAAALAARHGISTRYLHKLFEDEEMTYGQFVLDRRLALAYRRLRDPRFATRTISSIASDAGFGDLSYFNRTFRRRYDITPSGARPRDRRPGGPPASNNQAHRPPPAAGD